MPPRRNRGSAEALGEGAPRPGRGGGPRHLRLLGVRTRSTAELLEQVERGLDFDALERFKRETELSWEAVSALVRIPSRTLARRREAGRLGSAESDRLVRASRLFQQAVDLFEGDADAARRWLTRPQRALGGATPLAYARTETGGREVEQLIGRLEHGIAS